MSDVYKPKGRETGEGLNPPNTKSNVIVVRGSEGIVEFTEEEFLARFAIVLKELVEGKKSNKKPIGLYNKTEKS